VRPFCERPLHPPRGIRRELESPSGRGQPIPDKKGLASAHRGLGHDLRARECRDKFNCQRFKTPGLRDLRADRPSPEAGCATCVQADDLVR